VIEWHGAFKEYAAQHPGVGVAVGPVAYLPPDFSACAQVGSNSVLVWGGQAPVIEIDRPGDPASVEPADPDLGTGQQLKDYLPDWDLPDAEAMAKNSASMLMVWSVKNALKRGGLKLKNPAPEGSDRGWRVYPAGFPVPPDWRDG